jgi:hypothetical protein
VPFGSCKQLPRTSPQCFLYFSGPSESLMTALLSVENWVPLKGGVRDVALIHYPSCSNSIKPSLQFLCNFVVINASNDSICVFYQIFKCVCIIFSRYTVQTLENSRTENFSRLIFPSSKVFSSLRNTKKLQQRLRSGEKEGEEARLPFPVSDIMVKWPLCVTKHCYATTWQHEDQLLVDGFWKFSLNYDRPCFCKTWHLQMYPLVRQFE